MTDLKELLELRNDMELQDKLYQPTSFWKAASDQIVKEFEEHGMDKFRSLKTPLSYFVPTFGHPGNGYSKEQIKAVSDTLSGENVIQKQKDAVTQFFNGRQSALADYRVLLAGDEPTNVPHLHSFSESTVGNPIEQFTFDDRNFSRSSLNYLLGLCFLKNHLNGEIPKTVLEIGGGFGTLGEVLASSGIEDLKYIDIDIPPTSYAAQYYLSEILGEGNVATYNKTKDQDTIDISSLPFASVLSSWQIEKLRGKVDLFVNFISFQEMEPPVVKNYLDHVRRLETKWILLRNLREGKPVKTSQNVGVEEPILADDYVKMLPDYSLVASNVFPYGFQTVDEFNSELYLFRLK